MSENLKIDDRLAKILKEKGVPLDESVKELIVFELYRRGEISGGKGTELLGIDRLDFIRRADALGIPYFRFTEEEWREEMESGKRLARELSSSRTPAHSSPSNK